jgi:hypothetical protein
LEIGEYLDQGPVKYDLNDLSAVSMEYAGRSKFRCCSRVVRTTRES